MVATTTPGPPCKLLQPHQGLLSCYRGSRSSWAPGLPLFFFSNIKVGYKLLSSDSSNSLCCRCFCASSTNANKRCLYCLFSFFKRRISSC